MTTAYVMFNPSAYRLARFRNGLPTAYQARFWASKEGSNSVWFLSMVQAT